jgi:hypothetical protein
MAFTLATLDRYASALAGESVTVDCRSQWVRGGDVLGYVEFDAATGRFIPTIHLPARACKRLETLGVRVVTRSSEAEESISAGGPIMDYPDGEAVLALEHEALHILTNSRDESYVECLAYRNRWSVVRLFKLAAWKARTILWGMKATHLETPSSYRRDC